MRIILKRSALANSEATDLLSRIESKKAEMEKLSLFLSRRKDMRKSRAFNVKSLSDKIEKGNYLASDGAKLKDELERLKSLLAESEKDLLQAESEYNRGKGELDGLTKKFDAEFLVINFEQSGDLQKS